MWRNLLLGCGIASSLFYVAMNITMPMLYAGYSILEQTVSELSAIGAPTRTLWVWLGVVYAMLVIAFGWGVWASAGRNRWLRVVAVLVIANATLSLYWPPVHLRGTAFTLTDALHILWALLTVLLMVLAIGFGAAALGPRFRRYSIATLLAILAFGAVTAVQGFDIAQGLPTPWIGVWERIGIAAFMLWIAVLAIALLRRRWKLSGPDPGE